MAVNQQYVRCNQEVPLLALVSGETVATHNVLALGFAVSGDRDGFYAVFVSPSVELRAGQQGVPKDVDIGKGGQQSVEVAFEIRKIVPRQPPDKLGSDRHPLLRHGFGDDS